MGLAASQAQLLTITSRITDNELRAQQISEARKNLAIESTEVSQKYDQALDNAQMMLTNHGPDNIQNYQKLSFNALVNYNQFNNQYGISSSFGQLFVSETEAQIFKQVVTSSDPLKEFLLMHGLEYNTTYFEGLEKYVDGSGKILNYTIQQIKDLYTNGDTDALSEVFTTYGSPVFAWVDTAGQNNSGETKSAWYTNLFNRMKEGYVALEDGLASNPEWIQYQLKNGLVQMEQADENGKWSPFIYTSCSDITSQADDLTITLAEAEYRRALGKIENKDKCYDSELKTLDTEHSSLQTEYESIKAAINKNVERTLKIYSA
ncbi:MAG: hypothetical protein LBK53_02920 [Heliobacteriaceae bacterium]|jgi:hypothetical protein|nr:hypothetical protein [Heliobacteriaceae bacterium]